MALLTAGCKSVDMYCCAPMPADPLLFHVADSSGADLLDGIGAGALEQTEIQVLYLDNGKVVYQGRNAYSIELGTNTKHRMILEPYDGDYPGSLTVIDWGATREGRALKPDTIGSIVSLAGAQYVRKVFLNGAFVEEGGVIGLVK